MPPRSDKQRNTIIPRYFKTLVQDWLRSAEKAALQLL